MAKGILIGFVLASMLVAGWLFYKKPPSCVLSWSQSCLHVSVEQYQQEQEKHKQKLGEIDAELRALEAEIKALRDSKQQSLDALDNILDDIKKGEAGDGDLLQELYDYAQQVNRMQSLICGDPAYSAGFAQCRMP